MPPAINQLARRVRNHSSRRAELAARVDRLEQRVGDLERELAQRVAELSEGIQEQRRLSPRVASLSDFVAEVVSATARGDRDALDTALAKYADGV
jgi:septal ring factor EnvC (AmiA/AmiB activator)